jgi:phosphopentomutase
MTALRPGDLLLLTADHGNDPTFRGTDHCREYVPLIAYNPARPAGRPLGTRRSFADIGATIADTFGAPGTGVGTSFLHEVI